MGQKVSDFVHDFGRIIGELEPIMPLVSHVAATTRIFYLFLLQSKPFALLNCKYG
jgi:hypothetical protein